MNIANFSLTDVASVRITRRELDTKEHIGKFISIEFAVSFNNSDDKFTFTAFSAKHDNWTDACKELDFDRMFPNNIIIEHTDSDPFRVSLVATQVTEQEPF